MILVLAGTKDGRNLAVEIAELGYPVIVSVISQYAGELARTKKLEVNEKMLNSSGMIELIKERKVSLIIDASHPYAVNVSYNAMEACKKTNIKYLRYERAEVELPQYDKLFRVNSYQEAALKAASLGKTVFLTTGSRMLEVFCSSEQLVNHRLIARVLPDTEVLAKCNKLGFTPKDIIAMQGPFTHSFNQAMFLEYGADVIVTKNSGNVGGTDTKISAAIALGLPIVVIERPIMNYDNVVLSFNDILKNIQEVL